jgi:hypothetical protein
MIVCENGANFGENRRIFPESGPQKVLIEKTPKLLVSARYPTRCKFGRIGKIDEEGRKMGRKSIVYV